MAHPYLKARTKQKWIESAKHLRIPPSPTVWACGFSRGSVKVRSANEQSVDHREAP